MIQGCLASRWFLRRETPGVRSRWLNAATLWRACACTWSTPTGCFSWRAEGRRTGINSGRLGLMSLSQGQHAQGLQGPRQRRAPKLSSKH